MLHVLSPILTKTFHHFEIVHKHIFKVTIHEVITKKKIKLNLL